MKAVPAGLTTDLVGRYVGEKIGMPFAPGMFSAMAIINDNNEFVAGVVFSEFRDHDVQLSTASDSPVAWTDSVLRAVFDYTFNQLGCVRCTAVTRKGNRRARAFLEHLGFQLEGNLRLGYDGVKDALIYGLLASECRYLAPLEDATDGEENAQGTQSAGPDADGSSAERHEYRDSGSEREPEPDRPVHPAGKPHVQADWY